MKNITKICLLAIFAVFASCQNETLFDGATSKVENELALENEILVSDGEEDESFVLDDSSEILATRELSFSFSSNASRGSGDKDDNNSCTPDIEGFELGLPDTVTVTTKDPECSDTGGAFLAVDIADGDLASLDNDAYCIDLDGSIDLSTYTFDVYSSYDEELSGLEKSPGIPLFENPDDFDRINWLLNQDIIGTESLNGGTYTFGHVQWAIWQIIEGAGNNCTDDCDYLSCNPIDQWDIEKEYNESLGLELVERAEAGEGFVPQCGQQIAVVLASTEQQSLIMTVDVPEKEVPCSDCEGKVTKLELEFDWHRAKRVKIYQKKYNRRCAVKIFDKVLHPGEKFTIDGVNHDGTIGRYAYIFINHCYYTKIKTNCYLNIGPGYTKGVFNVIGGESSHGGELCEYVKPDYNKCYRHWSCKYYYKCRYGY